MKKIDKFNLRKVILDEYLQIAEGLKLGGNVNIDGKYKSITVSGMGGSALPTDIVKILLKDKIIADGGKIFNIYQNRTYGLPMEAFDNSLNVVCSYSGNTEESVSALKEAIKNNLPVIGVSNGGKVEAICKEKRIAYIKIPYPFEGFQPRMATGYFVFSIFKILEKIGVVKNCDNEFLASAEKLKEKTISMEKKGKAMAEKLKGATPVVYSTEKLKALAMIWKIKFNENSKTPAFWNFFPELNHNEMVGFTNPQAKFSFIFLRDMDENSQMLKRFAVMEELMKERGMGVEVVDIWGETVVEKIFSTLYLGDWVSYYLALSYETDPTPVEMVEKFKKMIS